MYYTITFYTIPSKSQPLPFTSSNTTTLSRSSSTISAIRSPHIDKRSWEQFKFFVKKQNVICREEQLDSIKLCHKILLQSLVIIRFQINSHYTLRFTSKF